jgi:GNAT superfamily N-acetyltransferase
MASDSASARRASAGARADEQAAATGERHHRLPAARVEVDRRRAVVGARRLVGDRLGRAERRGPTAASTEGGTGPPATSFTLGSICRPNVRLVAEWRLRLTTTNDNLDALRFYQRRGFRLVALRPGAVDAARALKPEIPVTGAHGIPLRDELDLERAL